MSNIEREYVRRAKKIVDAIKDKIVELDLLNRHLVIYDNSKTLILFAVPLYTGDGAIGIFMGLEPGGYNLLPQSDWTTFNYEVLMSDFRVVMEQLPKIREKINHELDLRLQTLEAIEAELGINEATEN